MSIIKNITKHLLRYRSGAVARCHMRQTQPHAERHVTTVIAQLQKLSENGQLPIKLRPGINDAIHTLDSALGLMQMQKNAIEAGQLGQHAGMKLEAGNRNDQ